jgi:hypothetical protein
MDRKRIERTEARLAALAQANRAEELSLERERLNEQKRQNRVNEAMRAAQMKSIEARMQEYGRNALVPGQITGNYSPVLEHQDQNSSYTKGRQGFWIGGKWMEVPEGMTPAENLMPILGEFGEMLGGMANTWQFLDHNLKQDIRNIKSYLFNGGKPPKGWRPPPKRKIGPGTAGLY